MFLCTMLTGREKWASNVKKNQENMKESEIQNEVELDNETELYLNQTILMTMLMVDKCRPLFKWQLKMPSQVESQNVIVRTQTRN